MGRHVYMTRRSSHMYMTKSVILIWPQLQARAYDQSCHLSLTAVYMTIIVICIWQKTRHSSMTNIVICIWRNYCANVICVLVSTHGVSHTRSNFALLKAYQGTLHSQWHRMAKWSGRCHQQTLEVRIAHRRTDSAQHSEDIRLRLRRQLTRGCISEEEWHHQTSQETQYKCKTERS